MEFAADGAGDEIEARSLNDRVGHLRAVPNTESESFMDSEAVGHSCSAFVEGALPASSWFLQIPWVEMRKLDGNTFVQVPERLEGAFCEAIATALREIASPDTQRALAGWKAFLLLPWLLLHKPCELPEGESCTSLLTERLDRFWQGDVAAMYRECQYAGKRKQNYKHSQVAVAKRVKTLSRAGETGRALRALDGSPATPVTHATVKALGSLFKFTGAAAVHVSSGMESPDDSGALAEVLEKDCKRLPRLSAAGPLQTRNEHLMVLAGSAVSADLLSKALAALALGRVPAEVVEFLRGGLLFPLAKESGDYRPLTLSNVTRRAALRSLLRLRRETVQESVGPLQYAVAHKAGTDALLKSLQLRIATHLDSAVVSIDFRAAFQRLDRKKACEAVRKHAPLFYETCVAWYGGSATHVIREQSGTGHEVRTDCGVDQGCPLGAFLFAVTMRDPAQQVLDYARALDENAAFYMYLDDCYIVARPAVIGQIANKAAEVFASIGLEIHPGKTSAWCSQRSLLPAELQPYHSDQFCVLKRALRMPGDVAHQGLPLSPAQSTLQKEMTRLETLTSSLQAAVGKGLDLQTAISLLRVYAGPASQHTLRSGLVSEASAAAYDQLLARSWSALLGRAVSPDEPRLWLPLRMGGCGAASARSRIFAAPWAAWLAVRDDVVNHIGTGDVENVMDNAPTVRQQVHEIHAGLVSQGTWPSIQFSAPLQALLRSTSQKSLVSFIHMKTLRALRAGMDDDAVGFNRSAGGPGAGGFLETPMDDKWVMANSRFKVACLRRLGVEYPSRPAPPDEPPACTNQTRHGRVCGSPCDAFGKHLECCAPGGGLVSRHDSLVRCLGLLSARSLDPRPKLEQIIPELARPVAGQVELARLDVVVHDGAARLLIDAVIVSAYASGDSFRRACARRDGHASRRAEVAKRSRYPTHDLIPFAVETGGRLAADARAFLVRCADASPDRVRELQYLYRAVSTVVQDGVARQLMTV